VFLDIFLVADTRNQPNLLIGKQLFALLKHVRVANVEGIEDTIGIDS
jgi:hypothetical protein